MLKKPTYFRWLGALVMGLFLFSSANVFAAAPNDQKEPVDPRLMVPIPDIKLNAPTFIPVNRSAQDIDITLEVDFFFGEASWNLWSWDAMAYYYPVDQTFSAANQTVEVTVALDPGEYSLDVFDTWGDGGIAGVVEQDGVVLVQWAAGDYADFGEFNFTVTEPGSGPELFTETATYTLGDISTDMLGLFVNPTADDYSTCPATLTVTVPTEAVIVGVDVTYNMTAQNGAFRSEQRSRLVVTNPGGQEEATYFSGSGTGGIHTYTRNNLTIANGVLGGGDIIFEMHAFRTWGSTAPNDGCGTHYNKVDDGTWTVTVKYSLAVPGLELLNAHLDLGERPIGYWMKPGDFEIANNPGRGDVTISAFEIDDNTGFTQLMAPAVPYLLEEGQMVKVGLGTTAEATDGDVIAGNFAVVHDGGSRDLITGTYEVTAYEPVEGDVWELAFDGSTATFGVPVLEGDFRNNYNLPGEDSDGWDNVYEFTFTDDVLVDVTLAGDDAKMALYAADFDGMGGPDVDNALVYATTSAIGVEVYAGTYYLAVSTTGVDYTLNVDGVLMPAPDQVTYLNPDDGAVDITTDDMLEWAWGANTLEYQVLLGTTYPPATVVQDWTAADLSENGTFELSNLNPNLQYFWQVNVQNNNDFTAGPIWGFTTTITPPANLVAAVVDNSPNQPTVSVTLEWTSPVNRAFLGYNVYRDGLQINGSLVTGETYTDLGVARNGSFAYNVTSVFDEGESDFSNTATAQTRGVGTFNGYVTDFLTTDPIEGAQVNIIGPAGSYGLNTDENGFYSTLAYAGTYNFTANASGYTSQTITGEALAHGAVVSNNIALMEVPYPVATVEAFELNDNSVQISWDGSGPEPPEPPIEEWLIYDNDVITFGGIGAEALDYSLIWASRWLPAQLFTFDPGFVTKVAVYQVDLAGDYVTEVRIMSGDGTNVLYTQDVTGTLLANEWNIIELDEAVPFDNTDNLWIGMYVERPGNTFCEPTAGGLEVLADRYDYFAYNGGPWTTITGQYGVSGMAWMLRAYVTNSAGREIALGTGDYESTIHRDYSTMASASTGLSMVEATSPNAKFPQFVDRNTRGILSYDVWREKMYQPGTFEIIGNTTQQNFVDFDWGIQDWGVYRWAVTVNYDAGQTSTPTYSNTLDKDMYTEVDVTVTLNSGDSPAGTVITFGNISEPELELIYDVTLDGSGMFTWDMFRRGTYNIEVEKLGYEPISIAAYDIFDEESFSWLLEEILATPTDLYVTPTGLATWSPGVAGPGGSDFEPFMEGFDDAIVGFTLPDGWSKTPVTSNWQIVNNHFGGTAGGEGPEMMFNWTPSGTNEFYATSPMMNTTGQTELMFSFKQMVNDYNGEYNIRVVTIADGVEYVVEEWLEPNADIPAGTFMYTLTATHGVGAADFQIAWVYDGNSFNINNWYVDDINVMAPARSLASRELEYYKVFLDGVLVAETEEQFHQYAVANLVDGETYYTEVAAVYSTGQSAPADFTWTYIACDNYATPVDFTAQQIIGLLDVVMVWTIPAIDPLEDQIAFARIYRDGEILAEVDAPDIFYVDEDLAFGEYVYCITFVYESGAETCVGEICETVEVTGGAFVDGLVVQAAYLGGAPVEGALVWIYNDDASFEFLTDADGMYDGEVLAGVYNYEVSAPGYITEMLTGIAIPEASTVTQNFELMEFPEAVRDVVAVELSDATVEISWRTPGYIPFEPFIEDFSGGISAWTRVPDAVNWQSSATSLAGGAAPEARFYWSPSAVSTWSFISPMMSTLTQSELELTFKHFLSHFSGPYTLSLKVIADGQEYMVNEWVNPTGWTAQTYTTMLTAADHGVGAEEFQIVFVFTGDSFNVNNWNIDDIMIYTPGTLALGANQEYMMLRAPESTLQGYNVYRTSCEDGGDLQFLGFTLDSIFNDNTWGTAASGTYKWGVEAVYAENEAEVIYSNCLDKDMVTTVSVTVSTNSGDLPTGTDVMFMNTSEPDLELVYEVELDETGFFVWDDFRKGTYDVYVELAGFAPVELFDVAILGPTNFVWVLEELLLPVSDLHVTPTGYATWTSGGELGFQPYFEDFESGEGDWISGAVSGADHWEFGTPAQANLNGAFSGVNAWATRLTANYDNNANTYLMRQFDFSDVAEPYFSVQLLLYSEPGWDGMILEYSLDDGGSWAKIAGDPGFYNNTSTFGPLAPPKWSGRIGTYQLFESSMPEVALESNVWLRFRFQSDGSVQDQGVAIDDIMIVDGVPARALEYYKVWHHGLFVADTENEFFQYDAEELGLVEGETYLAEVAAMYSNGMSAKMSYEWTFYGCENFNGPDALTAEVVNNENVVLNWSGTTPPPPPPVGEWLYYDDGTNVDGIGGPATFTWAIKFDPAQLVDFDGASLTKIQIYNRLASADELRIYEGTDAATLLHSQTLAGLTIEDWNEVDLTSPVLLDVSKELWIAVNTTDGANWPAGCGAGQNQPNGDLITLDGVLWEHLTDFGLIYTWNLRGYVTTEAGVTAALPMDYPVDNYSNNSGIQLSTSGNPTVVLRDENSEFDPTSNGMVYDNNRDLFDLLYSFPVGVGGGEYSVATDGDFIYTGAWNSATFYKYELDGTYIGPFTIAGAGNLRDLTYDGEFFYGSPNSTTIYQMDFTNGTLEGTITAPSAVRGIAYDEDADGFWVTNGWDGPLRLISRTGTVLQTLNTAAASYSGLAYDNASDGGPFLWGHNQPASNNILTKIDITTGATLETFDVSTVAPVGAGISGGMTITNLLVEDTWTFLGTAQNEIIWVIELAEDGSGGGGGGGGGGGFEWEYLGANVYRNGVLIAEMVEGETYTDEDVLPGDYTYCVTFVYDLGAESCFGDPCVDVEVTCESPVDLTGIYDWNYNNGDPEFGALIGWSSATAPVAEWLFYDDGTNVDGIGGPATFTWAIKFDPAQLEDFEGASLTKIQIYNRLASTDELRIYEGTNAATLLHSQPLAGLAMEAWEEVDLTSAVAIDISKQLWIAVYTADGVNFPAGCGPGQNQPNGDLITLDGALWEHLTDYGLIYTWNLRGFVTTAAGATVALPMDKPVDNYNIAERSLLSVSGKGSIANNVADLNAGRSLEGYNVYRSTDNVAYELIATVEHDPTVASFEYFDTDVNASVGYYYQVTAVHDFVEVICESYPAFALLEPENDYVYVLVTSIDDVKTTVTRLYPNPANTSITIEAPAMQRITVMNAIGQVVYDVEVNGDRQQLNTSSYEAGVYLVRITTAEGMVTKRVTIVR